MIGDLDMRACLQAPGLDSDGGGGFAPGWSDVGELWIGVTALAGSDAMAADRLESSARYRVILRRRGDVVAGMRLVTATRTLLIEQVLDEGPRAPILTLLCQDAIGEAQS